MLSREELIFILIVNCVRYILILILSILALITFAMFSFEFFTEEKEIKKSYDLFLIIVRINIILICMSPFFLSNR